MQQQGGSLATSFSAVFMVLSILILNDLARGKNQNSERTRRYTNAMRAFVAAGAVWLLSGCASSANGATRHVDSEGRVSYEVTCNDFDIDRCYEIARERCGGRYRIVDRAKMSGAWELVVDCAD